MAGEQTDPIFIESDGAAAKESGTDRVAIEEAAINRLMDDVFPTDNNQSFAGKPENSSGHQNGGTDINPSHTPQQSGIVGRVGSDNNSESGTRHFQSGSIDSDNLPVAESNGDNGSARSSGHSREQSGLNNDDGENLQNPSGARHVSSSGTPEPGDSTLPTAQDPKPSESGSSADPQEDGLGSLIANVLRPQSQSHNPSGNSETINGLQTVKPNKHDHNATSADHDPIEGLSNLLRTVRPGTSSPSPPEKDKVIAPIVQALPSLMSSIMGQSGSTNDDSNNGSTPATRRPGQSHGQKSGDGGDVQAPPIVPPPPSQILPPASGTPLDPGSDNNSLIPGRRHQTGSGVMGGLAGELLTGGTVVLKTLQNLSSDPAPRPAQSPPETVLNGGSPFPDKILSGGSSTVQTLLSDILQTGQSSPPAPDNFFNRIARALNDSQNSEQALLPQVRPVPESPARLQNILQNPQALEQPGNDPKIIISGVGPLVEIPRAEAPRLPMQGDRPQSVQPTVEQLLQNLLRNDVSVSRQSAEHPFIKLDPAETQTALPSPARASAEILPALFSTQKSEVHNQSDTARLRSETTLEAKLQSLLTVLTELKSSRIIDSANDTTPRIVAGVVSSSAQREIIPIAPSFIKTGDIGLNRISIPDQSRAIDPNNPNLVIARQFILGEAMSLKDLIAANNRVIDPARIGEITSLRGLRGDPVSIASLKGGDPIFGIRGGAIDPVAPASKLDPNGKIVEGKIDPTGRIVEGKFDPTLAGMKGMDILEPGKGGKLLLPPDAMPGDKSLTGDRKDLADKKDDNKNKPEKDPLTLVPLDKTKDRKPEKDKEDDGSNKKKDPEVRRKYIVREDDTLESIAEKIIGDRRFSLLLEIVNRGNIRYSWEGSSRKALLRLGQIIWLPTPTEVKVHRTLFFTKKQAHSAAGQNESLPAQSMHDSQTEEISETEQNYINLPDLEVTDSAGVSADNDRDDTVLINPLPESIPQSKNEASSPKDKFECRPGTWRMPKSLPGNLPSESDNYRPSWEQIQELLSRMKNSEQVRQVELTKNEHPSNTLALNDSASIQTYRQLDGRNRISIDKETKEENTFLAKLEREIDGEWKTVAYYETRGGKSVRYLNKSNGSRKAFYLNLPEPVVREMALKDFSKNWKTYADEYERSDVPKPIYRGIAQAL